MRNTDPASAEFSPPTFTAFLGDHRVATGPAWDVANAVKQAQLEPQANDPSALIFDDRTGRQVEFDLCGSPAEVEQRLRAIYEANPAGGSATNTPRTPGRPKLGVVAHEVTLLPRHWEWLSAQPGGASVTLRKLVDAARAAGRDTERVRQATEAADKFMAAMLGNQPGYEEASRALYRGEARRFRDLIAAWPTDLRDHALRLAAPALSDTELAGV